LYIVQTHPPPTYPKARKERKRDLPIVLYFFKKFSDNRMTGMKGRIKLENKKRSTWNAIMDECFELLSNDVMHPYTNVLHRHLNQSAHILTRYLSSKDSSIVKIILS